MNNTRTSDTSKPHKESNRQQRKESKNQNPPNDQDLDESNDDKEIRDDTPNSGRYILLGNITIHQTTTHQQYRRQILKCLGNSTRR